MTNKVIYSDVSCISEFVSEISSFYVELSPDKIKHIKKLAKLVVSEGLYKLSLDFFGGSWSAAWLEDFVIEDRSNISLEGYDELLSTVARVECVSLDVFRDGFCFTCIPKHASDEYKHHTQRLPLDVLNSTDTYLAV